MTIRRPASSDIAFTEAVKAQQVRHGSRDAYARMEQAGGWETELSGDVVAFIAAQNSFFLATANAAGQPYIQHRGGPKGFLHVLDGHTLAFADLRGNKQYISVGNLTENPKVHLFLMNWAEQQRVKIWGEASVVDDDAALLRTLTPPGDDFHVERAMVIRVHAWDANCRQHIPQRLDAEDVARAIALRDARIRELEEQVRRHAAGERT